MSNGLMVIGYRYIPEEYWKLLLVLMKHSLSRKKNYSTQNTTQTLKTVAIW